MKILLYTLNFWPEPTGCGKLAGEMAEWLSARGHQIRVITAPPYYPAWRVLPPYRAVRYQKEWLGKVPVWRCPLWVPAQKSGWRRILHLASFAASSLPLLLAQMIWRPDVIMAFEPTLMCAPAVIAMGSITKIKTWLNVKDLEMDAAFDLNLLPKGPVRKFAAAWERWILRRFMRISTISASMQSRLEQKSNRSVLLLPDWTDVEAIHPLSAKRMEFRNAMGIDNNAFVVLYSGNIGEKQGVEIIARAAQRLAPAPGIMFLICGAGAGLPAFARSVRGLKNVILRDLVPAKEFNLLLNLADLHLLPQKAQATELVMPSKLLNILAAGGMVVATANSTSEVGRVVQAAGGLVVASEDDAALASAIQIIAEWPLQRRNEIRNLARSHAERYFSRDAILGQYERKLHELIQ